MKTMKTIQQLLIDLKACEDAREWAEDKTIEEIVEQCHRGDWLLWLADKVDIGVRPLALAKGHCANTVRHLMTDDISIKAVDVAIRFGEGKATEEELNTAALSARNAVNAASTASDAWAAFAASNPDAWAASWNAAWAAVHASDDADAFNKNLHQTADICREYIGDMIIQKCNELMNN